MSDDIKITELALYKMCREVYNQYKAQHSFKFSDSLTKLHEDVEAYLQLTVDEFENETILTFVLKPGDIRG